MFKNKKLIHLLKTTSLTLIFISLIAGNIIAQFVPFSKKVYKINEVKVVGNRNEFYGEDQKKTILDTTLLEQYSTASLSELISHTTPVFIKSYGSAGSIAIPSLRGSSSSHTSITWNGFPIHSMTLGQTDLSGVPVEFMNEISVTHGASGSLYGNATFGGNIDLKNEAEWKNDNTISVTSEYGSWNNQRYGAQANLGNKKIRYQLKGLYQNAENNFTFHDTQKFGSPEEEMEHNNYRHYGIMQNLFYKISPRNQLETGVWYQVRDKNIPALMGEYGVGTSTQKDSSLRAYVKWNRIFSQSSLHVKTGYFYNNQLYTEKENPTDEAYALYSPIVTSKWLNDVNYRHYLNNHITLDIGGQYSLLSAKVNAYNSRINEYRASLIGAVKIKYPDLTTNISVRQQFNNHLNPKPQVSLGMQYQLINDMLYARGNLSTKYRIPTFNDKYWNPGGNKDIRPERGWSGELGLQYVNNKISDSKITAEITGYTSRINDLIQWVPKDGAAYWHAINTSKVQTMGVESAIQINFQLHKISLNYRNIYNYAHSVKKDAENTSLDGRQLRYTPVHTMKNNFYTQYSGYTLGSSFQYTGKRYTNSDNSSELPGYFLTDVFISKKLSVKQLKGKIQFSIKNLLDNQYQVIANYPMPGRAFYIKLNINVQNLFTN